MNYHDIFIQAFSLIGFVLANYALSVEQKWHSDEMRECKNYLFN